MASKNLENDKIIFKGVNTHNLQDIDIEIPKNKITTITGVSGSGKSSLAFDTIYKEGQYRYIESLSSYLRQFFNLGTRPEIDYSQGLSPSIAIEQNKRVGNSRSTVGTLTEIDDYFRLMFAKLGDIYCYNCGSSIQAQTIDQIINDIKQNYSTKKTYLIEEEISIEEENDLLRFLRRNRRKVDKGEGFVRFLVELNDGNIVEYFYLEDVNIPQKHYPIRIFGIYDRVTIEESKLPRLKEDIIKILGRKKKFGVFDVSDINKEDSIKGNSSTISWYTDKNFCANCNITYPDFTSQHFSANRQEGACEVCQGIGKKLQVDFDKIIDPHSNYLNAIIPWRDSNMGQAVLEKLASKYSMDKTILWKELPEWYKDVVLNGDGELLRVSLGGRYSSMYYKGVEDLLTQQYHKGVLTVDYQAMLEFRDCPQCEGAKLRRESLNVYMDVGEKNKKYNIAQLQNTSISNNITLLKKLQKKSNKPEKLLQRILTPLMDRAGTIDELGVGYMTLNRQIDTLSGGEIQRLRLAKQLGNKLTGIIYVLDEPTIGLDEGEIKRTIKAIKKLKDMGNTIIVVEHNEEFIKNSDWVVEIGPGSGDFGGYSLYSGTYKKFLNSDTLTAKYLTGEKEVEVDFNHKPTNKKLSIKKASKHNLQNIDVDINLGSFTIINGPSGAGKTTLMYDILYKFLAERNKYIQSYIRLNLLKQGYSWSDIVKSRIMDDDEYKHNENVALQNFYEDLGVETIRGYDNISNMVYVDQSSIGKTPRSCPSTFIGVFDDIRKIYAGTEDAKIMGFMPGHFSFNSKKGACPECEGYGQKKVELQFLPDTYVPCELCGGNRYKSEILGIYWHGKNIADVLNMYIYDALDFFQDIPFIEEKLQLMVDIGLGYLKMGQPAHTLSGGESQRLKLVKHLLKTYRGHTVYFLDEPTVGLHPFDINKLLEVLKRFLNNGDTILMIEHDKNLLKFADDVTRIENGKLVKNN